MKTLTDYQAVSNQLKEANNEKVKIKKEGDKHVEDFLKEKKDLSDEKEKISAKIKDLMTEKLKNDMHKKDLEKKLEQST